MFDSSTDKRVVLQQYREIPQEVVFRLSDSIRDNRISNRYWFNFPEQWFNQLDKDAIIGIRSMYLTKTTRYIAFDLSVELYLDEDETPLDTMPGIPVKTFDKITVSFRDVHDGSEDFRDICKSLNEQWKEAIKDHNQDGQWDHFLFWFDIGINDQPCKFNIGLTGNHSTTYIDVHENDRTTIDYRAPNRYFYMYQIQYTPISDACKSLIPVPIEPGQKQTDFTSGKNKLSINIWSRYHCYIKSSISNDAIDQFLGHTRNDPYSPLKYYRLTSKSKRFWIELYETRNHKCPVSLPDDKLDDLFIEAIICFTSAGMI